MVIMVTGKFDEALVQRHRIFLRVLRTKIIIYTILYKELDNLQIKKMQALYEISRKESFAKQTQYIIGHWLLYYFSCT